MCRCVSVGVCVTLHSFEYLNTLISQCIHVDCHLQGCRNSVRDDVADVRGNRKAESTDFYSYLLFDHREALHLQVGSLEICAGLDEAGLQRLQVATQLLLPQGHSQQLVNLLALCSHTQAKSSVTT